jgi:hypothetical protein
MLAQALPGAEGLSGPLRRGSKALGYHKARGWCRGRRHVNLRFWRCLDLDAGALRIGW